MPLDLKYALFSNLCILCSSFGVPDVSEVCLDTEIWPCLRTISRSWNLQLWSVTCFRHCRHHSCSLAEPYPIPILTVSSNIYFHAKRKALLCFSLFVVIEGERDSLWNEGLAIVPLMFYSVEASRVHSHGTISNQHARQTRIKHSRSFLVTWGDCFILFLAHH